MKKRRAHLPAAVNAVAVLGAQIGIGRRELGWTAADLAERLGVNPQLVGRIERGATGTAIGTVMEAAVLCGIPLFSSDPDELGDLAQHQRTALALLPGRVRRPKLVVDDDF